MKQERNTAIVLAAGQGKRMHSKIQKQFLEIGSAARLCIILWIAFRKVLENSGDYSGNR